MPTISREGNARRARVLAASGFAAVAVTLSLWGGVPGIGVAGLAVSLGVRLASELLSPQTRSRLGGRAVAVAWVGTAIAWGSVGFAPEPGTFWEGYYALTAGLVALSLLPFGSDPADGVHRAAWRGLALTWAGLGTVLWMGAAYLEDHPTAFVLSLILSAGLLLLCRGWFRLPRPVVLLIHTLVLLLLLLPLADLVWRTLEDFNPEEVQEPYAYETARHNPAAFRRWWRYYLTQWNRMAGQIFVPDPAGQLPLRLRPGAQGHLMQSTVRINRHGFRGPEIREPAGNTYRIVVLGESTTFGCTLRAGDRPWPELLEEMIRDRLQPDRPVEVINAGIPACTLEHSVSRLQSEILPLQPDMILSYHGYNGLGLLRSAVGRQPGQSPPPYPRRPLALLAQAEYRWRMMRFRAQASTASAPSLPTAVSDPTSTACGEAYLQLISIAQENQIRLGLADFSMAVNEHSPLDVAQFYRAAFPSVLWSVAANAVHTRLVAQLARRHPKIFRIDTHPDLDGEHARFIDLVHLTQDGRRQLAENFYSRLAEILPRVWSQGRTNPAAPNVISASPAPAPR